MTNRWRTPNLPIVVAVAPHDAAHLVGRGHRPSVDRQHHVTGLEPERGRVIDLGDQHTRRVIVDGIASLVRLEDRDRRVMMRDPGGDAIDAVLAALGAAQAFATADHSAIARHARYPREGHLYF